MYDLAGWLLLLFSFSIVLMWKSIRDDAKVVHAIWFCLVLHHAVVFMDVYFPDASTFHWNGVYLAASPEPEWLHSDSHDGSFNYINSLGFLYRALGASLFFGEELSVLAFVLSCVVLVKLVDHLDLRRFRVGIVLFFGLLPSAVIFRSVTLRESWQALFFLLSVYWTIRLCKRPGILIFSFMLMSVFCMALLHNGLSVYAMYFILTSVYWGTFGCKKSVRWERPVRFLFTGLLITCVILLTQKMGLFVTVEQALEGAEDFRRHAASIHGRATYGVMLDTSSVYGLVTTIPMIFVQYMFAPFPWHIENVKDIYALLESMLRFGLLFFAVYSWRRPLGEVRNYHGFLLMVVLGLELTWALGTLNWGTAMRHHVPGHSVIVLLGAPGLILFMRNLHLGMFGCRKDNTMLPK
jgi:hypothetical protein